LQPGLRSDLGRGQGVFPGENLNEIRSLFGEA